MRVIKGFELGTAPLRHATATVGSFDGVHCGHSILLDTVKSSARTIGGDSVVLTFEPHPRITLHNDEGLRLLTTLDEKLLLLDKAGIDVVVVIPFDEAFSRISHEQFITNYIIGKLGIERLVVGYNHRFGRDKGGDGAFLRSSSAPLSVICVERQDVAGRKVSSTTIRHCITSGDMASARSLLGHPYMIQGHTDATGTLVVDKYKMLPPVGTYTATIERQTTQIEVLSADRIDCGTLFANQQIILEL